MKIFKKIFFYTLVISITLGFNVFAYSKEILNIPDFNTSAKVLQVLDGDTIQVQLPNKDTAYVKLKGINAKGFDTSYDYLTNTLLGQNVTLVKDGVSYINGKFNYMIVYFNDLNINEQMVKNGYAIVDEQQIRGSTYNSLVNNQNIAKQDKVGMWAFDNNNYSSIDGSGASNSSGSSSTQTTGDRININTASTAQLQKLLKDVSSELAKEIVTYREKNPFSNIQEIKFVKGFTKKIYDKNKASLTVATNINKANEFELKTLNDLSDGTVKRIVEERNKKLFTSTSQISDIVTVSDYRKISNYIFTEDINTLDISEGYNRANISLSEKSYLTGTGMSYSFADDIIANRKNGYTYKTLMELSKLDTKNITEQELNYLQDNLNVFLNLNTTNKEELNSAFGSVNGQKIYGKKFYQKYEVKDIIGSKDYDKAVDVIYVDKHMDEYININTATKEQMYAQNIPTNQTNRIIEKRPIKNANVLPVNVSEFNNKISLYTNINTASKKELQSLNNGITNALIDKIIKYREQDNFGSLQEIEEFFRENNAYNVYEKIKNYIVVR